MAQFLIKLAESITQWQLILIQNHKLLIKWIEFISNLNQITPELRLSRNPPQSSHFRCLAMITRNDFDNQSINEYWMHGNIVHHSSLLTDTTYSLHTVFQTLKCYYWKIPWKNGFPRLLNLVQRMILSNHPPFLHLLPGIYYKPEFQSDTDHSIRSNLLLLQHKYNLMRKFTKAAQDFSYVRLYLII